MLRVARICRNLKIEDVEKFTKILLKLLQGIVTENVKSWRHDIYFNRREYFYDCPIYEEDHTLIRMEKKQYTKFDLSHNTYSGMF